MEIQQENAGDKAVDTRRRQGKLLSPSTRLTIDLLVAQLAAPIRQLLVSKQSLWIIEAAAVQDSLLLTCRSMVIREIQKAHIKHPMAMVWIIGSSEADSMYIAESTKNSMSSEFEHCIESGKGNQNFITLLPIWLLGQRSG